MNEVLFLLVFSGGVVAYLTWGWRTLPRERWQVLASVPTSKQADGTWLGMNFTYYGLFTANAYAVAVFLFLILLASVHVPIGAAVLVLALTLSACVPASRWIARWVEKKQNTFTVGGASFLAIVFLPAMIGLLNLSLPYFDGRPLPFFATLAGISAAYSVGESVGRLACVSFGCCYGRPIDEAPRLLRPLFRHFNFRFEGSIKKAAYEGRRENQPLIPIQAITSIVLLTVALSGIELFLSGDFALSLLITSVATQGWRLVSELFRADHRGYRRFTSYQWMAIVSIIYVVGLEVAVPSSEMVRPSLESGFAAVGLGTMLLIQAVWVATFFYTGRSKVTGSLVTLHLCPDAI